MDTGYDFSRTVFATLHIFSTINTLHIPNTNKQAELSQSWPRDAPSYRIYGCAENFCESL